MPRIKVNGNKKHPRPYFPKELIKEGFIGEMEILGDAMTATIIHPSANLEQVKKSLEIILLDIDLRMERAKQGNKRPKKKPTIILDPVTKRFKQS